LNEREQIEKEKRKTKQQQNFDTFHLMFENNKKNEE